MEDILIIGNGFDLDLGLRSRYSDFYESDYWPFHDKETPLAKFMESRCSISRWVDLEEALAEYGSKPFSTKSRLENDEPDFELLRSSFREYILNEQKTFSPKDSVAARLLKSFVSTESTYSLFSFNFTSLNYIAKRKLWIPQDFDYSHIHGCAEDGTDILGVGDYANLTVGSDFMYKSFDKNYAPPVMIPDMQFAKRVIMFGVSLGKVDYQYFDDYFRFLSTGQEEERFGGEKEVVIFTYDDKSRMDILRNLQTMTDHKLGRIFARHELKLFCTKPGLDEERIDSFLEEFSPTY